MATTTRRILGKHTPKMVLIHSNEPVGMQEWIARVTDKSIPLLERKLLFKHFKESNQSNYNEGYNEIWYKKRKEGGYHIYMLNHKPIYTNTSIFVKKTPCIGITFTQEKGLTFWRGTQLYGALNLLEKSWRFLGMEFVLQDKYYLKHFLLERTLKKIFEGKVSNPNQVLKMYLANKKLGKVPIAYYKTLAKRIIVEDDAEGLRIASLERFLRASSNMERDSAHLCSMEPKQLKEFVTPELFDTIQMANMVGEKVNFTWSLKRWRADEAMEGGAR